MRKILSLIICLLLCFNIAAVFAADNDLVAKGMANAQKTFSEYIDMALNESGIDRSTIDEKQISISGLSDHYGMKRKPNPYDDFYSEMSVIIPLADGSDTWLVFFEQGKITETSLRSKLTNMVAKMNCPIALYTDEPAKFIEQNNFDDVEEILNLLIWDRLHMSAYYVKSGGKWYIIPYYFYKSYYNRANNEECNFEIGKAYTQDEFIRISELEDEDTQKYLREQREKEELNDTSDPILSKDKDGNDIIKKPGSDKWERLDEIDNDTKKDTDKSDKTDKTDKDKTEVKDTDNKDKDKTDVKAEDKKTDEKTDAKTDEPKDTKPEIKTEMQKADALKEKGLFKGTENGYELDRTLTRSEGATMLIRLLGKEDKALTSSYTPVFDDVAKDDWYYGYVMCAYNNNIVMGTSSTEFTPDRDISAKEFTTLVLRALGHETAAPENAFLMAQNAGLLTSDEAAALESKPDFTRGDMVGIAYTANEIANQTK